MGDPKRPIDKLMLGQVLDLIKGKQILSGHLEGVARERYQQHLWSLFA